MTLRRILILTFSQAICTDPVHMKVPNLVHASLREQNPTPGWDVVLVETWWAAGLPGFACADPFTLRLQ